ncbi:pentapeptide repeat-containing protein [Mycetocola manganoxydans]|uniref:Pentapeptide repeat-containing protein n=2 Tax=Mycetocola manganoxydans TaxID=699879 RepID=A0A3L6ZPC4_9MICO|nr:pentapeptide repeat-containing protein [Mycetocola manganoxydans]
MTPVNRRDDLRADCSRCVGLCCVALAFARSADFAFTKDAGDPCVNLDDDYRCVIHPELRQRGFKGCTVFDCFGAGQKVTQHTFGGASWRDDPEVRARMFATFPLVRQLQELLVYLDDASSRAEAAPVRKELEQAYADIDALTEASPEDIAAADIDGLRRALGPLLSHVSELVRDGVQLSADARARRPGAELFGAHLAGQDLRGANLRGAWLIGADLRSVDLSHADVLGADFRDAELGGANLSETMFLTQFQVNAAQGDAMTLLPESVSRPSHWRR